MQWSLFFLCFVEILGVDKYVHVYKYLTSAQDEFMFTATAIVHEGVRGNGET